MKGTESGSGGRNPTEGSDWGVVHLPGWAFFVVGGGILAVSAGSIAVSGLVGPEFAGILALVGMISLMVFFQWFAPRVAIRGQRQVDDGVSTGGAFLLAVAAIATTLVLWSVQAFVEQRWLASLDFRIWLSLLGLVLGLAAGAYVFTIGRRALVRRAGEVDGGDDGSD